MTHIHVCNFVNCAEDSIESPGTPHYNIPQQSEIAQGGGEAPACEAEAHTVVSITFAHRINRFVELSLCLHLNTCHICLLLVNTYLKI